MVYRGDTPEGDGVVERIPVALYGRVSLLDPDGD